MPAPKTAQPDHTTPATIDDAVSFAHAHGSERVRRAATVIVRDLVLVMQQHTAIRLRLKPNNTGTSIPYGD